METYDLAIRHGTHAHGVIDVTEAHNPHLFAKRGKTPALFFGSRGHCQEIILRESGFGSGSIGQPQPIGVPAA